MFEFVCSYNAAKDMLDVKNKIVCVYQEPEGKYVDVTIAHYFEPQ